MAVAALLAISQPVFAAEAPVDTGAQATLSVTAAPKVAAGQAQAKLAPQVASLGIAKAPSVADVQPTTNVDLSVDPFRQELVASNAQSASVAAVPNSTVDLLKPTNGARFVPMFRHTDQVQDPSSRASFSDLHVFGVELKSNF